ncbi:MAG: hypothetical protein GWO20_17775 [Candidatus Korarchaeota archaeon]|nr:hypothetical protein [Candidatus Korarchaeota archaeon]NIU83830.1 hypothetical protein [Candidatus Thorarchaeota archaeon]NIW15244.1 hypothetical protein [Candidatus Thorarchaeota archaeon]NIW53221.1 hypothetical protein [Candidatus Korarchaeota archaeon]
MIQGKVKKDKIVVKKETNSEWRVLWGKGIGKNKDMRLELKPVEALYLQSRNNLKIIGEKGELTREDLIHKFAKRKKHFWKRYLLYEDMKKRGYNLTLRTGKIELYKRGESPLSSKPIAVMIPIPALGSIKLNSLIKEVKQAEERGLDLALGIVDRDGTITYYKVKEAFEKSTTLKLRQKSNLS